MSLLKEGFTQEPILPATVIVDLDAVGARPEYASADWDDVGVNSTHALDLSTHDGYVAVFNSSPQKLGVKATGEIEILVPGVYEVTFHCDLQETGGVAAANIGMAITSGTAGTLVNYGEIDGVSGFDNQIPISGRRTATLECLVDVSVPTDIHAVLVERTATGSQAMTLESGYLKIKCLSEYAAVTRVAGTP